MSKRLIRRILILILAAICPAPLISISSGAERPRLVPIVLELFTSEGCSSCPPADQFLRNLDSSQPLDGAQLIVLEEHVDYWDDQGWRDPFSSHEWTLRQTEYARRLHVREPYTPQVVVNGNVEFLGSDGRRADQVLNDARTSPAVNVQISHLGFENGKLHARIETAEVPSNADVYIALALDHTETQVKRGENGGRHLEHVAVLQNLHNEGKVSGGQSFTKDVTISAAKPGTAYRVIGFVQESGQGKIVGAAVERIQP